MVKNLINIGGTSTGLILDKAILELLKLEQGSQVELSIDSSTRTLTVRPAEHSPTEASAEFRKAQKQVVGRHRAAFKKLAKR